jgi:hypothetical protein
MLVSDILDFLMQSFYSFICSVEAESGYIQERQPNATEVEYVHFIFYVRMVK